jgi:hypothetical protein
MPGTRTAKQPVFSHFTMLFILLFSSVNLIALVVAIPQQLTGATVLYSCVGVTM